MNTPIYNFVKQYNQSGVKRLHMPGHKGKGALGAEAFDITEILGADSLFEANGIISESEKNAAELFCTGKTLYSCEGSTLVIKTVLALCKGFCKGNIVLAGANSHKSFIFACAELDLIPMFIETERKNGLYSSEITAAELEKALCSCAEKPVCVYLTTPDYLGNMLELSELVKTAEKHGVFVVCDGAHGAYLNFSEVGGAISKGVLMCAESAHKTLPVLTGGAYLHISKDAPAYFKENAKSVMSIFGSTSPSYLILQSLDLANKYLEYEIKDDLKKSFKNISDLKKRLCEKDVFLTGNEPLKLTVNLCKSGFRRKNVLDVLKNNKIEPELCDEDFLIFMLPLKTEKSLCEKIFRAITSFERFEKRSVRSFKTEGKRKCSVREAIFSQNEIIKIKDSVGRVCGIPVCSCPPAIPPIVSGCEITEESVKALDYFGYTEISVIK